MFRQWEWGCGYMAVLICSEVWTAAEGPAPLANYFCCLLVGAQGWVSHVD